MTNELMSFFILFVSSGFFLTCSGQGGCNGACNNMETFDDQSLIDSEPIEEKRKFSPWAGKRGGPVLPSYIIRTRTNSKPNVITHKKSRFSPWHGKRSGAGISDPVLSDNLLERLLLQYTDSDIGRLQKLLEKRGFNPWAGK